MGDSIFKSPVLLKGRKEMKKKLIAAFAVVMSLTLVACGENAEEEKAKLKKKLDEDIDSIVSDVSKYVDDETDLGEFTGTTSADATSTSEETSKDSEEAGNTVDDANYTPDMSFTIVDMDGNVITESVFRENKLTMINFWEPWCGPCVSEMPEIEKLYKNYKDKGLYVIGVFSATDQIEEVKSVLQQSGTTYPIAEYSDSFDIYQTGYVPTTIFVDQDGHVIPMTNGYSDNAIVGSNSYADWAAIVDKYLK
jgi:Thiol-disulfide isomerase and thioredoxins